MWACARGHHEAASLLCRWRPSCLTTPNRENILPLTMARIMGHVNMAQQLELIEKERQRQQEQQQLQQQQLQQQQQLKQLHISTTIAQVHHHSHSLHKVSTPPLPWSTQGQYTTTPTVYIRSVHHHSHSLHKVSTPPLPRST